MNLHAIGQFIKQLRKSNKLTQKELADKLNISAQAVSRWENGESLPDTFLLMDLADILNVTVDMLLKAGLPNKENIAIKKFNVLDVEKGFQALESIKTYFGEKSLFYIGMINGISKIMNFDFEDCLKNYRKLLYKEVIISALNSGCGYYIEKEEVEQLFQDNYKTYEFIKTYDNEYWKNIYQLNLEKNK
jgi:transcriptional regulator with XRE-family HTH domain